MPDVSFLLLGDSHAAAIGKAARAMELRFVGGPIGAGRDYFAPFFVPREEIGSDQMTLQFTSADAVKTWAQFQTELAVCNVSASSVPLLCTFGTSFHFPATSENWWLYREQIARATSAFFESKLFTQLAQNMLAPALEFYRLLKHASLTVHVALPPQRVPNMAQDQVFLALQQQFVAALKAIDVPVIDVRNQVCDERGMQLPAFSEANDPIHGNLAFGKKIVESYLILTQQTA
jgi:hypothetical protein